MAEHRRRRKRWSFSAGSRGSTVAVYEREPGGPLHARVWDRKAACGKGGWRRVALGHRDREAARRYALEEAAKLHDGITEIMTDRITLSRLFALYLAKRTPRKVESEREADERRAKMWLEWLGADKDPHAVTLDEWESFADGRRKGLIDALGLRVAERERRPVRNRTVEADLIWLKLVLNWGTKWRTDRGYLLRENPVRGFDLPSEKNVRRPVATQDRFEAIRSVSDQVSMEIRWDGRRRVTRSYLSELLDVANDTGRRISAVCSLQFDDLRLDVRPYGAVRWRADTDKTGRESVVPISQRVRAAIDRIMAERPGVGSAYLFPAPTDLTRPISRYLASDWLREAEAIANVPKQAGGLWHPYRRGWATARKHLPDVDVAAAGGWAELTSLKKAYQQTDDATMLRVVLEAGELRERRA